MAQDREMTLVGGVPTLQTTSDNVESFTNSSGIVSAGDAVYITGNGEVALANNDTAAKEAIGLVFEVTDATNCRVITQGLLEGFDTGMTANDRYYLHSVDGELTTTKPSSAVVTQVVGIAYNATDLFVYPMVGITAVLDASVIDHSLDDAYDDGATITTDAGPVILAGTSPGMRFNDDIHQEFGDDTDGEIYYNSAGAVLLLKTRDGSGQSGGVGDAGVEFQFSGGTGAAAVAGTNTGGTGSQVDIWGGTGGAAAEGTTGNEKDAGGGGTVNIYGNSGGVASGASDVANSAGDAGDGGNLTLRAGLGGLADAPSGSGTDHGAAGVGGDLSFLGGYGGSGSTSELGGAGGDLSINAGAGGTSGGAGVGTAGTISIGVLDTASYTTSAITLGQSGNTISLDAPTDLPDSITLSFGDAGDASMKWDGAQLEVLPIANNADWAWGENDGSLSWNIIWYGTSGSNYMFWDSSGDRLQFDNASIAIDDDMTLGFGNISNPDVAVEWDTSGGGGSEVWLFDRLASGTSTVAFRLGVDNSGQSWQIQNNSESALFTVDGAGQADFSGNVDATGGVDIDADNASLTVGESADLTIVHDATNTTMTSATGDLIIDNTLVTGSTIVRLGTTTSATDFQVQSDTPAALFTLDGSGQATFAGNVDANGGLDLPDDVELAFGDSDDIRIDYFSSGNEWVVTGLAGVGQSGWVGTQGVGEYHSWGNGAAAVANTNTGGLGGNVRCYPGVGGAAAEGTTGQEKDAGAGGYTLYRGGTGGSAEGATDSANSAGDGGTGGILSLTGGTGGIASEASGSGTDHGAAGTGGGVTLKGGPGGAGTASEPGGSGGSLTLDGGPAGADNGGGTGTGGLLNLGASNTTTINLGHSGAIIQVAGPLRLDELSKPSNEANKGFLYCKDDGSGNTELYYLDESDNEIKLTEGTGVAPPTSYTLDDAYNAGATITVDAGPVILTTGPIGLRLQDDVSLNFGDSDDCAVEFDTGSTDDLTFTGITGVGSSAHGVGFDFNAGSGAAGVAGTTNAGPGGDFDFTGGIGGAGAEGTTGNQKNASTGGVLDIDGGIGGAGDGATDSSNFAGDGGDGGGINLTGGTGGSANDATGTGTDDATGGDGGPIYITSGTGGAGTATQVGGTGGVLYLRAGAGAPDSGAGAGTAGSLKIGDAGYADSIYLGNSSADLYVPSPTWIYGTFSATTTALRLDDGAGTGYDIGGSANPIGDIYVDDSQALYLGASQDLTLTHDATNTVMTSATGDFILDNTLATGSTINRLGTDTSATDFQVQNNTEAALFTVNGAGQSTFAGAVRVEAGGVRLDEGSAPTAVSNAGFLYTKDMSTITELFYLEDSGAGGTEIQITEDGALKVGAGSDLGTEQMIPITLARTVSNPDGTVVTGQLVFNAGDADYSGYATFVFGIVGAAVSGQTGTVQLYNLTDTENTGSSLAAVTTVPAKYETTLTVGSSTGNLQDTEKIYEVRVSCDGSTSAHTTTIGQAYLRMEN